MKRSITPLILTLLLASACPDDEGSDAHDGTSGDAATSDDQRDPVGGDAGAGQGGEHAAAPGSAGAGGAVTQPRAGAAAANAGGAGGSSPGDHDADHDADDDDDAAAAVGGRSGAAGGGDAGTSASAAGGGSGSAGTGSADNAPNPAPADSDEIVSVAFTVSTTNGDPVPVVLFEGGYATYDASIVTQSPVDAAAHRKANPDSWTPWRRISGYVELKTSTGWEPLVAYEEAKPLPKATALSKLHERFFSPDPNGNPLIYLSWRYRFHEDGTFEYCKTSVIVGTDPDLLSRDLDMRAGRYHVDGYTLRLDDDKGVSDTHAFFYEGPVSDRMWIDGLYYYLDETDEDLCSS
ncbi:MAG: hypothetical protein ABW321_23280 [Polyangiales bacterium]